MAKRFAKDLIQALFSDRPEEKRGRFQGSLPRLGCLVGPVPGIDPLSSIATNAWRCFVTFARRSDEVGKVKLSRARPLGRHKREGAAG